MSIRVILPAPLGKENGPPAAAEHSHVWKSLPTKPVVGLIDNTKGRAADLLNGIGRNLVKRGFADSFFMIRKPHSGVAITEADKVLLLARAHMIVSGLGD
jgi:hypothetical protein